ncbi:MAG: exodeoxyribonuclease III [Gammaproteobacteria bacterium 28-57-27]|nr:MAG: exodeoxyribonuclease III [Gammaproteobacteria bacterium 28-57-27]
MKIATWNVNSLRVRLPHVLDWLQSEQPDVLVLQEIKLIDELFPHDALREVGYECVVSGQPTYNGVAILAKLAMHEIVRDIPGLDDPQRRVLAVTIGDVRVVNVYIVNGEAVGSEKYAYKLAWLDALEAWLRDETARHPQLVLLGDFNIAPDDRDVHDPAAWEGRILCSEPERSALARLHALGLVDVFRQFEQEEKTFSWWDYRMNGFKRNLGLRIDLILASQTLAEHCTASYVDKIPRSWERPSDHAPVVAEFS